MPEVDGRTLRGQAQFASKRDLEDFVTGLKKRTGERYAVRARKVRMVDDDGRESFIYEVEWFDK